VPYPVASRAATNDELSQQTALSISLMMIAQKIAEEAGRSTVENQELKAATELKDAEIRAMQEQKDAEIQAIKAQNAMNLALTQPQTIRNEAAGDHLERQHEAPVVQDKTEVSFDVIAIENKSGDQISDEEWPKNKRLLSRRPGKNGATCPDDPNICDRHLYPLMNQSTTKQEDVIYEIRYFDDAVEALGGEPATIDMSNAAGRIETYRSEDVAKFSKQVDKISSGDQVLTKSLAGRTRAVVEVRTGTAGAEARSSKDDRPPRNDDNDYKKEERRGRDDGHDERRGRDRKRDDRDDKKQDRRAAARIVTTKKTRTTKSLRVHQTTTVTTIGTTVAGGVGDLMTAMTATEVNPPTTTPSA
jgi:hypothetical protein